MRMDIKQWKKIRWKEKTERLKKEKFFTDTILKDPDQK